MTALVSYPDMSHDTITDKLDVMVRALDACDALSTAVQHPILKPSKFGYSLGKKYARVFYEMSNGQTMVAFFVQLDNGDVWKADGWKKPALNHPRGNINTPEGRKALTLDKMTESGYFYAGL